MVHTDDRVSLLNNYLIETGNLHSLLQLLTHVQWREYAPVGFGLAFLMARIIDLTAFSMQFINHGLHVSNSLLVYWISRNLKIRTSGIVSIAFLVHPMNSELLGLSSGFFWLLGAFFSFLSMALFVKWMEEKKKYYIFLYSTLFCLALLTKAGTLITLAFYFFLWIWRTPTLKEALPLGMPTFIAVIFLLGTHFITFSNMETPGYFGGSLYKSLLAHFPLFTKTVVHWILPLQYLDGNISLDLSTHYGYRSARTFKEGMTQLMTGALGMAVTLALFYPARKNRIAKTGILFFLSGCIFYLGVSPQQFWHIADRYTYISGLGLIVAVALSGHSLLRQTRYLWVKRAVGFSTLCYLIVLFDMSVFHVNELKDPALFSKMLKRQPEAHYTRIIETGFFEGGSKKHEYLKGNQEPILSNEKFANLKNLVEDHDDFARSESFAQYLDILAVLAIEENFRKSTDWELTDLFLREALKYQRSLDKQVLLAFYFTTLGNTGKAKVHLSRWTGSPVTQFDTIWTQGINLELAAIKELLLSDGNYLERYTILKNYPLVLALHEKILLVEGGRAQATRAKDLAHRLTLLNIAY